jgi:PPOX class probable F420-dependent enzyme
MATLTEEQARFVIEPNFGILGTVRPDGSPQLTSVWIDWDGQHVLFNTSEGRMKERYLRRDARATLLVADRNDPYKWVSVSGRVDLTNEGADEHTDKLAKKYLGVEEYPWRDPAETRVIGRLNVEHVNTYGL